MWNRRRSWKYSGRNQGRKRMKWTVINFKVPNLKSVNGRRRPSCAALGNVISETIHATLTARASGRGRAPHCTLPILRPPYLVPIPCIAMPIINIFGQKRKQKGKVAWKPQGESETNYKRCSGKWEMPNGKWGKWQMANAARPAEFFNIFHQPAQPPCCLFFKF